jgi:hypothetical protein
MCMTCLIPLRFNSSLLPVRLTEADLAELGEDEMALLSQLLQAGRLAQAMARVLARQR